VEFIWQVKDIGRSKMIPRFKPDLDLQEIIAALTPPHKDDVERFEQAFAEKMEQRHAIAFPYGRTGLMLLLEAMGLKGKEVICPAYTCVVVPHAIVFSGNTPVFVDCEEGGFNMDLNLVPEVITSNTGAIIATSIFGYPVDLDKLDSLRNKYPHIKIIQDCAHSFAAKWKGRHVQKAGDAAIFGLNISKIITSIFGGMVTTDNDELADKLRRLRNERLKSASLMKSLRRLLYLLAVYPAFWKPIYGIIYRMERAGLLNKFVKYYNENIIDMPKDYLQAMSKLEARVGIVQTQKYDKVVSMRIQKAFEWYENLQNENDIKLPPMVDGATYSHFVCIANDRKAVMEKWRKKGIQLGQIIEYCIPYMKAYSKYRVKEFPFALKYSNTTVNFPLGK